MAKINPDFDEATTEGRQFYEDLSTGGKVALAIVVFGVYIIGWLVGLTRWPFN